MRYLLAFLLAVPALAQPPAAPAQTPPTQVPSAEAAPAAPAKAEEAPASPIPSAEEWLSGSVDLGYQWLTGVGGSMPSYRSIVDLGSGPKLFGIDFTILDPKKRLFDRLDARGSDWGGYPYTTAHVDARKANIYNFSFDYRNVAYFNALPSFANPNAPGGFDEQAFDIRRRMANASLDLFPSGHIIPYLVFERNSGYGNGIATWLQDAVNEYAVPTQLRNSTNNYRGGVRFEYNRYHVTLEQGGTTFKDDDQAFNNIANPGDSATPFIGQKLALNSLQQAYGIRGESIYSRGLITANPVSWITVSGQFLYSLPKIDVNYTDIAGGNLAMASAFLFYTGETALGTGTAKQPHVTGNAGFEMRPLRRLRIVESWTTDRYHDASFGLFSQLFVPAVLSSVAPVGSSAVAAANSLQNEQVVNYNQQQLDVMYDLTSKLTLRGGHRYVWGDASVLAGQLSQTGPFAAGALRRNVALAGVDFRPWEKLTVHGDYEGASSDHVYFQSSLNDYQKGRARVRYQATTAISLQANFSVLNNQNPAPGVNLDFQSRDSSLSAYWSPAGGKRLSVMAEYDRTTLRSDIGYLSLPFLSSAVSSYRENAHSASSAIDLVLPGYKGMTAKLTVGGSLFVSSGSRPTRFYEPLTRLSIPISKKVSWNTEWRYYGLGEAFYLYEGFRAHLFLTGLRITR